MPLARIAAGLRNPVLAKCEHLNPGGSVKNHIALAIVDDAERRGATAWCASWSRPAGGSAHSSPLPTGGTITGVGR